MINNSLPEYRSTNSMEGNPKTHSMREMNFLPKKEESNGRLREKK